MSVVLRSHHKPVTSTKKKKRKASQTSNSGGDAPHPSSQNHKILRILGAILVAGLAMAWMVSFRPVVPPASRDPKEHVILFQQRYHNWSSKDAWNLFALHREHVMQHAWEALHKVADTTPSPSHHALLLGVGNGNDIDLKELLGLTTRRKPSQPEASTKFETLTLVDLDSSAVTNAVQRQLGWYQRQTCLRNGRIVVSPSTDLAHVLASTADWETRYQKSPPTRVFDAARQAIQTPVVPLHDVLPAPTAVVQQGGYDVAVSLGLLSTFPTSLEAVVDQTRRPMDLMVLTVAIRRRHLAQVAKSLRPGGRGVILVDLVHSDTLPELLEISSTDTTGLQDLADRAERENNFFRGTKRSAVAHTLQSDVEFTSMVDDVAVTLPWKRTLEEHRHAIVYGVTFRRKP